MTEAQSTTKQCPSCTKVVPANARVCPECGDKIVHQSLGGFLALAFGVFLVAAAVFGEYAPVLLWGAVLTAVVFVVARRKIS